MASKAGIAVLVLFGLGIVLGLLLFSRRLGLTLERRLFPLGRKVRLEKPLQSLYWAMHEYRLAPGTLACPPRLPSVPTSRATRVTSDANADS